MADESDPQRDAIHAAIQANPSEPNQGRVLTGWVVMTEWMDSDGERWLARAHSAGSPWWAIKGFLHEGLFGDWSDDDA